MPTYGSIKHKLADIYADLSRNVTNIYGRTDLHLAIDLVFHSPLRFTFGGRLIEKGYPEVLIIGDTRCLGGETLIHDPVTKVSTPVSQIKGEFHVHAWDGNRLVIARAEKPFSKDVDKLYTVTLATGESFVCSKSHVVLTPYGWRAIGQLQVGSAVFRPHTDIQTAEIKDIVYKRDDVKWDFTVPIYHNYLCAGVIHHNTGKTQCAEALSKHYGLGVMAQAESMSIAGLVGGCQKVIKERWDVTWGKIPQNNRRMVIIDEASGLSAEDISKLSSIRSSGIATIEKIVNQRTEAKTRLLWISNPRDNRTVNEFSSGIDCIHSLCPQPEDVARWDMAIIISKDDVPLRAMHSSSLEDVPHRHTSKLCHALILWAWTREPKEVIIGTKTQEACTYYGEKMSRRFSSDFTLVIGAEMRLKLARLSAALAARLFSTEDGVRLLVTPDHVEYIYEYLNDIYTDKYFGYDTWSANRKLGGSIRDKNEVMEFMRKIGRVGCLKFLELSRFRVRDIEEYLGISSDEAKAKMSKLLMNNAMKKLYGDYYCKTPQFNAMLAAYGREAIKADNSEGTVEEIDPDAGKQEEEF